MNKKVVIATALAAVMLAGCGEKDAKYYAKHPDALNTLTSQCAAKVAKINKSEELKPGSAIYADKDCILAYRAVATTKLGSVDAADADTPHKQDAYDSWWGKHLYQAYGELIRKEMANDEWKALKKAKEKKPTTKPVTFDDLINNLDKKN